ncbi:Zinc finger protein 40 [Pleurotus ostreatus]|nr:Zinc finger protein 40 [Pleurotus ostreatus]
MFSLSAADNSAQSDWPRWSLPATDPDSPNSGAGPPYQSAAINVNGHAHNRLPSDYPNVPLFGSNFYQARAPQPTNPGICNSGIPSEASEADRGASYGPIFPITKQTVVFLRNLEIVVAHSLYYDQDTEARVISIRDPSAFSIENNELSSTQGPVVRPVVASQATIDAAKKKRRGQAPFACPHCPNSFTTKKNRNYHILSHMGVRPFGCDVCGLLFRAKGDLSRHKKSKKHCHALQVQSERAGQS